jgi:glutamate 5-kinase
MFTPGEGPLGARKLWIALGKRAAGEIVIDDGAKAAVTERQTSLLPAGVLAVSGTFEAGDAVELRDRSGSVVARGLTGLSADEIERVKGMKTSEIAVAYPELAGKEVVHRDGLAIL